MISLLDDESGTATEDEEDVRARELRKQEVWLKVPPRNCDTDTGSETEVKQSQGSIDPAIIQESFISFESKVTSPTISNMNTNDNDLSSERNTFGKFSNETALISNELVKSIHDQDSMISTHKNGASLNVISQISENVICATDSMSLPMLNNTNDNFDPISDQSESLIFLTSIALGHLDKEDCNSEYESFVDESIRLELDELDDKVYDDCSQSNTLDVNIRSLTSNSINFNANINDWNRNNLVKNSLNLTTNNLKEDSALNSLAIGLETVAKITVADIPCIETSKDSRISDNETILNANELPGVITSLNENKNSLSSSSSEIYQSVEMLYNDNSIITDHLDDLEYSKSNLSEEIEIFKCENISVTNQSKDSYFINKDRNVEFIDDSNNIRISNIIDKNVGIHSTTSIPPASVLQESIHPIVIVTSPSPTQEIQLVDELSLETSRLLVPLEARSVPSFGNAFDKLKRDLKQRKAKNKAIGNELRPLSTEYAKLKMSKYFTENKKIVSKGQGPIQSEGAEDTSNLKMVKLHIKPKLSNRVNAEEMLKYFNKTSSSNSNKSKTSNIIAIKQNERRKLEIDIEEISNLDENDIDVIDKQFNQIEEQSKIANLEQSKIANLEDDEMSSQFYLSEFEAVRSDEKEIACDNLDLIRNGLIELNSQLNIDNDHIDPLTSNNISTLENKNISDTDADTDMNINTNNFKFPTAMISNILQHTLQTDVKNNVFNITDDRKEQERINPDYVLNSDINGRNQEKKDNINLNSNMIGNIIKENNIIKTDVQTNILNNTENEEKRANTMNLDGTILTINSNSDEKQTNKIHISSNNMDKDKSKKNVLFENNTLLNGKLTASSRLNNNTIKVIKYNRLHKSDTNLNEDTPRVFPKNINSYSKSLSELKNMTSKDESAVKTVIVERIVSTSVNIKDTIINNNLAENQIKEVPKRPERKNVSYDIISPLQKTLIENHNLKISNTELFPPAISVRKKLAKKSLKLLCRNQIIEDTPKLQSQIIENISRLHGQNSNNVFSIQSQDVEKLSKIKSRDIKDVSEVINQDVNDVSKIHCQDIQNPDTNSIDVQRPIRRNVTKLQSRDIINLSNFNNEIIKDKNIIIAENHNITDMSKLQSQSRSVMSAQEVYHTNSHLSNIPEESIKFIPRNSHSKKDKCVIS